MSHDNENKKEKICVRCGRSNLEIDKGSTCSVYNTNYGKHDFSTPPSEVSTETWEIVAARTAIDAHKKSNHYSDFSEIIYQGCKSVREEAKRYTVKQLLEYYYKQRQYKDSPVDVVIEEFCEIENIIISDNKN